MNSNIGRIPPHNHEAEQAYFGSVILESDIIYDCKVKPHDLYLEIHKEIYNTLLEMKAKEITIDIVSLGEQLDKQGKLQIIGDYDYINDLLDKGFMPTNAKHYSEIILEKSQQRKLIKLCSETIEKAYSSDNAYDYISSNFEVVDVQEQKSYKLNEFTSDVVSKMKTNYHSPDSQLAVTGIKKLDKKFINFKNKLVVSWSTWEW